MLERHLQRFVEQGRGCGCPGDDLLDDQTHFLLGLHRALSAGERDALTAELNRALRGEDAVPETWLDALVVVGLVLGLAEAPAALEALEALAQAAPVPDASPAAEPGAGPDESRAAARAALLRHRADELDRLWREAAAGAGSGQQVVELVRRALARREPDPRLEHADPRALAEAWPLDPSTEVRAALLELLARRSEAERRSVEEFLARTAEQLAAELPEDGEGLLRRLTGWLRHGRHRDALYLELLRCLPGTGDEGFRAAVLARCARHPSALVARRAATQLFYEALDGAPGLHRPLLEALSRHPDGRIRDGAAYALETIESGGGRP